jgi:hypothetical protein
LFPPGNGGCGGKIQEKKVLLVHDQKLQTMIEKFVHIIEMLFSNASLRTTTSTGRSLFLRTNLQIVCTFGIFKTISQELFNLQLIKRVLC